MSDSIPSIPTPPMTKAVRRIIYAVWAWGNLFIAGGVSLAAYFATVPKWVFAIPVIWQFFGSGAGFLAKNNVK